MLREVLVTLYLDENVMPFLLNLLFSLSPRSASLRLSLSLASPPRERIDLHLRVKVRACICQKKREEREREERMQFEVDSDRTIKSQVSVAHIFESARTDKMYEPGGKTCISTQ